MDKKKPDISLVFPVYHDEATVEIVTKKALGVLAEVADQYEVVIVDDGSPDRAGEIADRLASEHSEVRVIHHDENRGYGEALQTGLSHCRHEWICLTDGDDEYDVYDLRKLVRLTDHYDLIITFRYVKRYSSLRIFISAVYNFLVRRLFRTPYRDISTGLRLVRKSLVERLNLTSSSPFIGAELTIKTMLSGHPVGEVGIQTFPRQFGRSSSTSTANIIATIRDMLRVRRTIFSENYELPDSRKQ